MGRESKADRDGALTAFMTDPPPSLLRTAWVLTGSADCSQELVRAALVKTYAAWPGVRRESNQKTDTRRRTSREVVVDDVPQRSLPPDGSVENRDEIWRMLDLPPRQQRTIIVQRYHQDQSKQQTADLPGVSVGAVKCAASRGLATLRTAHLSTHPHGGRVGRRHPDPRVTPTMAPSAPASSRPPTATTATPAAPAVQPTPDGTPSATPSRSTSSATAWSDPGAPSRVRGR